MPIKKSELYSSLWQSCDELRGGMDASQYKDYVLSLLFIKYISDKYASVPYAPITVPVSASFAAMVALKGTPNIGDDINKKIIAPLAKANQQLSQADFPDFNDPVRLGDGKEKVERLTNLIAIFENPALDFSRNRAEGDDILGDAYEYLMRHFATESGKSKGQFYTPAEVSRIMAQVIGIRQARTTSTTTVYDPTCGSGSLLLKVADEARGPVTLYGQEKDAATSGLARMNMILHNNPIALVMQGNTLTDPKFKDGDALKTFDFVVANPPFSDKRWSTGLDPENDPYERFSGFGVPPTRQGDYAYLLHIVRSLRSTGKGACILPHGVLFRGNAEGDIRRNLVRRRYIKGIIGLPANLFYGTGIPACIVVIDKEGAPARQGIFMIDASAGVAKDGPKNRLRAQDIHRIVDVFTRQVEAPKYARMVSFEEIERNDYNLNLPRYIDSQTPEDVQDIEGHLRGGTPGKDIDSLDRTWQVCPQLRPALFTANRPGYFDLAVDKGEIKAAIFQHPEFAAFSGRMNALFAQWRQRSAAALKSLQPGFQPKELITGLSEDLLAHYTGKPLVDPYAIYQQLMDYWTGAMQDDCYILRADGWKAETYRIVERDSKGRERDKGWTCDLVPKYLVVARYFAAEQVAIDALSAELESVNAELAELEAEQSGEDGSLRDVSNKTQANAAWNEAKEVAWQRLMPESWKEYQTAIGTSDKASGRLAEFWEDYRIQALRNSKGNITKTSINGRLKADIELGERQLLADYLEVEKSLSETRARAKEVLAKATDAITARLATEEDCDELEDMRVIERYLDLINRVSELKTKIKTADAALDAKALAEYPRLSQDEIKTLVVDDKWLAALEVAIRGEMDRISQALTQRVKELAERYETPLPQMDERVDELEARVNGHLERMGFAWK